ncbi:DoxX family protein [Myxococcota bacterium]|nr:DoxX family protein [Myxococcota bacterium]
MSAATDTQAASPSRALHVGLWVVQVLLALLFGMVGAMKSFTPIEELSANLPWVSSLPRLARFIGASELLGAIGLIAPAATRIQPWLTPLAGAALLLVMVLAVAFHLSRGEFTAVPVNLVLGGMAAFVAWGRWKRAPVRAR